MCGHVCVYDWMCACMYVCMYFYRGYGLLVVVVVSCVLFMMVVMCLCMSALFFMNE